MATFVTTLAVKVATSKTPHDFHIRFSSEPLSSITCLTLLVKLPVLGEKLSGLFAAPHSLVKELKNTFLPAIAPIAYPLKVYGLSQNGKFLNNAYGDLDFIEWFVVKINDPFTFHAPKVLMFFHSAIKSLRIT